MTSLDANTRNTFHGEDVCELKQINHTKDTISQDNTYETQTEASNIQIVTPNYKSGEKPGSEVKIGSSVADLNIKFAQTNNDYKAERSQEHFRMQIIDPKVNSNAHLPAHVPREYARKKLIEDFPSLHGKRSFLNLEAMQQRNIRNTQPITTNKYLTESVDRHRDAEDLDLKKYLKAREDDANKLLNKSDKSGFKKDNESLRELEKLRQSLDALQKYQAYQLRLQKFQQTLNSVYDNNHINQIDQTKNLLNKENNSFLFDDSSSLQNQNFNLNIFDIKKEQFNELKKNMYPSNMHQRWRYVDKFDFDNLKLDSKNEIITSNELLERDRFQIDLLKKRAFFIDEIPKQPEIKRFGKTWQPPMDASASYYWKQKLLSSATLLSKISSSNIRNLKANLDDDQKKINWTSFVSNPTYKYEDKHFSPIGSLLSTPKENNNEYEENHIGMQFGLGYGELDKVAKRQLRNVVTPARDGSHRPKEMFNVIRQSLADGFIPNSSNVILLDSESKKDSNIKKLFKRSFYNDKENLVFKDNSNILHQTKSLSDNSLNSKKNCLTLSPNLSNIKTLNSPHICKQSSNVLPEIFFSENIVLNAKNKLNDCKKIYDLPAHSSTLTSQDYTKNKVGVNIKHCRNMLELKAKEYAQQRQQQLKFLQQQNIEYNNQKESFMISPLPYNYETCLKSNIKNKCNDAVNQTSSRLYCETNKLRISPPLLPPKYNKNHHMTSLKIDTKLD